MFYHSQRKQVIRFFLNLYMTVKISRKDSVKSKAKKVAKATSKSKHINWDKYFGKIKFPVDALAYQTKVRDEWGK